MLAQHAALRKARGWGGGLEQAFYSPLELEKARTANPGSKWDAWDYRKDPRHSFFVFGPGQDQAACTALIQSTDRHYFGRNHETAQYKETLTQKAKPGDRVILLVSLDDPQRVPDECADLLPLPWPEIENRLKQGEILFQKGKARELTVFLLAAPKRDALAKEFRRLAAERSFVP